MEIKQAGTGPSRRHIHGSKIAKGRPRVNLQYSKIEKAKKLDRVAHRGPLARAPGALKGGHFRNCQHFCLFHNAENLKGGPFGIFKNPICCKGSKKLKEDPLERKNLEKVSECQKN